MRGQADVLLFDQLPSAISQNCSTLQSTAALGSILDKRPKTPETVPKLERLSHVPPRNDNSPLLSWNSMNPYADIGSQGSRKAPELLQM